MQFGEGVEVEVVETKVRPAEPGVRSMATATLTMRSVRPPHREQPPHLNTILLQVTRENSEW